MVKFSQRNKFLLAGFTLIFMGFSVKYRGSVHLQTFKPNAHHFGTCEVGCIIAMLMFLVYQISPNSLTDNLPTFKFVVYDYNKTTSRKAEKGLNRSSAIEERSGPGRL